MIQPTHICTGETDTDSVVNLLLEPRSLYILNGEARYKYAHEILPPGKENSSLWEKDPQTVVNRGRRISLIFRDELVK